MNSDPYKAMPAVPRLDLTSDDIADDQELPLPQRSSIFGTEGLDRSPHLAWSGAPESCASYVVTVFDVDAPTGSGFWHWAVANIPATESCLVAGCGEESGSQLPVGAVQLPNDARMQRFVGAAPPPGRTHRYYFSVHALDVPHVDVSEQSTPALLGFLMYGHVIGRGTIVAVASTPPAAID